MDMRNLDDVGKGKEQYRKQEQRPIELTGGNDDEDTRSCTATTATVTTPPSALSRSSNRLSSGDSGAVSVGA
ncbi:hypothetical protein BGZ54_003367, partial [Gamsiella multidivaricata]